jgi:dTDP-4-amino-4,6-dideoxygalactose transaminase
VIALSRPMIGDAEQEAVRRVLASGRLAQGPEVEAFEEEFSDVVGQRPCVAVSSGTSALHLALMAAGVGQGDEVILPSFTHVSTANAVRLVGAEPVFADIDPETFCVDADAVGAAVSARTAALLPVHLYGHPAPVRELRAIASEHGLLLIEDASQAHMATVDGRPVGAWGDSAVFSFYGTKNMTTGEGGMVVTDDEATARAVRLLRSQGGDGGSPTIGFNARMPEVAAAMGRVQLRRLTSFTAARQSHAAQLDARLQGVVTPSVAKGVEHVFHQYTVRAANRDELESRLTTSGIGCAVYYRTPVHHLPAHRSSVHLPETDRAAAEVLSLPVGPHLTADDVGTIVEAVNR